MLAVEQLTTTYDAFRLGPIDLRVDGEILAVLGPSGCGKTTLLETIAGFADPAGGRVSLDGRALDGRPPESRDTVLVSQAGALFPHMTVRENVAYAAADPDRVEPLARTLAVADLLDRPATTLSGGERQRVAVARALAAEPSALLLDEPLANLDAPIKRRLRDDLRTLLAPLDIPVIYVTHDQAEATGIGDRIAVMRDGGIEQRGPPEAVFASPVSPFVAGFTGNPNAFEGTLRSAHGAGWTIEWGELALAAGGVDRSDAGPVSFTVRPEHVRVLGPDADAPNAAAGRIADRVFEGDHFVVRIELSGAEATLEAKVLPARYDRLGLGSGGTVTVSLPPDRIHVFPAADD